MEFFYSELLIFAALFSPLAIGAYLITRAKNPRRVLGAALSLLSIVTYIFQPVKLSPSAGSVIANREAVNFDRESTLPPRVVHDTQDFIEFIEGVDKMNDVKNSAISDEIHTTE